MTSCGVGLIYIVSFAVYVLPVPTDLGDFGYNYIWRILEIILMLLLLATLTIPHKTTEEYSSKITERFSARDTIGPYVPDYHLPELLYEKSDMVKEQAV